MSGRASTKAHDKNSRAAGQTREQTQHPTLAGPHADLMALQHIAGNRAVNEALQTGSAANTAPIVQSTLNSGGQPLDPSTRAFMEQRFGQNFDHVRVHTDAQAAESAQGVSAKAYTVGRDIVFNEGRYVPETGEGKRLLAHELAHVVQQGRGGSASTSATESDAGQAAAQIASGQNAAVQTGAVAGGMQREPLSKEEIKDKIVRLEYEEKQLPMNSPEALELGQKRNALAMQLNTATPSSAPTVSADSGSTESGAMQGGAGGAPPHEEQKLKEGGAEGGPGYEESQASAQIDIAEKLHASVVETINHVEADAAQKAEAAEEIAMQIGDPTLAWMAKKEKFQTEAGGGLVKAASDAALGVSNIVAHPLDTANSILTKVSQLDLPSVLMKQQLWEADVKRRATAAASTKEQIGIVTSSLTSSPLVQMGSQLAEGATESYRESYRKGKYGEIAGRLLFDIGGLFVGGGGAARGAKAVQAAGQTQRIIRNVGKVGEISASAGKAAEVANVTSKAVETTGLTGLKLGTSAQSPLLNRIRATLATFMIGAEDATGLSSLSRGSAAVAESSQLSGRVATEALNATSKATEVTSLARGTFESGQVATEAGATTSGEMLRGAAVEGAEGARAVVEGASAKPSTTSNTAPAQPTRTPPSHQLTAGEAPTLTPPSHQLTAGEAPLTPPKTPIKSAADLIAASKGRLVSIHGALEETWKRARHKVTPILRRGARAELQTINRYLTHGAPDGRQVQELYVIPSKKGKSSPDFVVKYTDGTMERIENTAIISAHQGRIAVKETTYTNKSGKTIPVSGGLSELTYTSPVTKETIQEAIMRKSKHTQLTEPLSVGPLNNVSAGGAIVVDAMTLLHDRNMIEQAIEAVGPKVGDHVKRIEVSYLERMAPNQPLVRRYVVYVRSGPGFVPLP